MSTLAGRNVIDSIPFREPRGTKEWTYLATSMVGSNNSQERYPRSITLEAITDILTSLWEVQDAISACIKFKEGERDLSAPSAISITMSENRHPTHQHGERQGPCSHCARFGPTSFQRLQDQAGQGATNMGVAAYSPLLMSSSTTYMITVLSTMN